MPTASRLLMVVILFGESFLIAGLQQPLTGSSPANAVIYFSAQ
jgi:hypothetical protein